MITGCTTVNSTITTFYEDSFLDKYDSFALMPLENQEDSLEYELYANKLESKLEGLGLSKKSPEEAQLAVFFAFGVDGGTQVQRSYPILGSTGGGTSTTTGSFYNSFSPYGTTNFSATTYTQPSLQVVGTGVRTDTIYRRYLNIDMYEMQSSRDGKAKKVYENRLISNGSTGNFNAVSDCILQSAFNNFILPNGTTREYSIPMNKCSSPE